MKNETLKKFLKMVIIVIGLPFTLISAGTIGFCFSGDWKDFFQCLFIFLIFGCIAEVILFKLISDNVRKRISIVIFILGVLNLIIGISIIRSSLQKSYKLEDSITSTIINNVNTYYENKNKKSDMESGEVFVGIGVSFTILGGFAFILDGVKTKNKCISKGVNVSKETVNNDTKEQLNKLYELYNSGILTQDEFNNKVLMLSEKSKE